MSTKPTLPSDAAGGSPESRFDNNVGLADFAFASQTAAPDIASFTSTLAAAASAKNRALDLSDPAQRTLGNYQLIAKLGQGGMGVVFRAREPNLDRDVALKLMAAGSWASPEFVARFRAEAQLAARLHHPNIVPIFEINQVDDLVFFTMALIEGETLSSAIKTRGPFAERDAAELMHTLAEAIEYAHRFKILHLDLKPSNVLLDHAGQPQIADFGLSRRLDTTASDLHEISGTPNFMAPEQFDPTLASLSVQTDIYGLGGVLYQMLTGVPAFDADSVPQLKQQVLHDPPRNVCALNPKISHDMAAICAKCLQKSPLNRYASARALADDLQRLIEHRAVSVRKLSLRARFWRWAQREPKVTLLGSATLVALIAGIGGTAYQAQIARVEAAKAAQAERFESARRGKAESLVGFIFDDLSASLTPLKQQKLLSTVGEKAVDYFDAEPKSLTISEIELQARILMHIFQLQFALHDSAAIERSLARVVPLITELQRRAPSNEADLYAAKVVQVQTFLAYRKLLAAGAIPFLGNIDGYKRVNAAVAVGLTKKRTFKGYIELAELLRQNTMASQFNVIRTDSEFNAATYRNFETLIATLAPLAKSEQEQEEFRALQVALPFIRLSKTAIVSSAFEIEQAFDACPRETGSDLQCALVAQSVLDLDLRPTFDRLIEKYAREVKAMPDNSSAKSWLIDATRARLNLSLRFESETQYRQWHERFKSLFGNAKVAPVFLKELLAFELIINQNAPPAGSVNEALSIYTSMDLASLHEAVAAGFNPKQDRAVLYALALIDKGAKREAYVADALSLIPADDVKPSNSSLRERARFMRLLGKIDSQACAILRERQFSPTDCAL
jgi:serine/threonine protein kinase